MSRKDQAVYQDIDNVNKFVQAGRLSPKEATLLIKFIMSRYIMDTVEEEVEKQMGEQLKIFSDPSVLKQIYQGR